MGSCMSKSVRVDSAAPFNQTQESTTDTKGKMESVVEGTIAENQLETTQELTTNTKGKMESVGEGTTAENQPKTVQNQSELKESNQEEDLDQSNDDDDEDHKLGQEGDGAQKKEKLTEEQIEEVEKNTIDNVQVKIAKVKSTEDFDKADEDGHFPVTSRNLTIVLFSSYFALKKAPLDKIMILRRKISNIMIELKAVDVICEIFKYYTYHGYTHEVDGVKKVDLIKTRPFFNSILVLLNFTDASDELAVYIANYPDVLETIRHVLVERKEEHLSNEEKSNSAKLTKYIVSLAHNISMRDANVKRLRDLDFTSAIQPFLHSSKEMIQLNALATLASIVNEKESEIINANQDTVKILLKCLEKGLKTKLRRNNGWSCKEGTLAVRMLARNDANKNMLAELGAVELLVKVGQTGNEEEKFESVQALWTLAFDPEIRKKMVANKDLGIVELLQDIKLSCELPAIKKACGGALWVMREELKASSDKKYQELGHHIEGDEPVEIKIGAPKKKKKEKSPKEEEQGHIMISYQWANQKTLIKVRDQLRANGFKVWMDIDQMAGSTLQSMADAVENSTIFLMSMSHKYKDSPNCRAEAEYAFTKKKKIIPLLMDQGYKPDGWLGFILGAKLFFEFSGKYPFEDKMGDLIKEINMFKQQHQGALIQETITPESVTHVTKQPIDTVDSPQVYHRPNVVSKTTVSKVRQWKPSDVQNWINKNDLKSCSISQLTGGEVALLMTLRQDAPEYFYKCLETMLNVNNLLTMSKIVWALTDLAECG